MVIAHSSLADLADFILRVADVPTDDLKITAFEGTEGISELFRFRVDLCSDDPDIDGESFNRS